MACGEHDDDDAYAGPPPDIADRVWRHPAEVAQIGRRHRRRRTRRLATLAIGCSVGAGVLASSAGGPDGGDPGSLPAETAGLLASPTPDLAAPDPSTVWALDVSADARAATLVVQAPDGSRAIAAALAIGSDGLLLTSSRALGAATTFLVHGEKGTDHTATLVGHDHTTDIAVLQIEVDLPPAPTAPPPSTGDPVAVVDRSGGARADAVAEASTITETADGDSLAGVFALTTTSSESIAGAPIVDERGGVVGITVSTAADRPDAGVPIDVATRVAAAIHASGGATHSWLGVSVAEVGPAIVTAITADGPAAEAGVEIGDRISAIDDEPIGDAADLLARLLELDPGDEVDLEIERDGELFEIDLELGERVTD